MILRRSLLLSLAWLICLACSKEPNLPGDLREKLEEAIESDTHAIQVHPDEPAVYVQRGQHYVGLREYDRAMADFSKAIEKGPHDANAYIDRGDVYMRKKMYDHALADYNTHLELVPDSKFGYSRRAVCRSRLGKMELAIADYDKAEQTARSDPSRKSARLGRCCVNYRIGNVEEAIEDCKQVCAAGGVYGPKFSCDWEREMERELETGTKGKNICMMPTCPSYLPRQLRLLFVFKYRIWFEPYP